MSQKTKIQWCDSTINPVMGCAGCELFPPPSAVLRAIDSSANALGFTVDSRALLNGLIHEAHQKISDPGPGHHDAVSMTNLWHLRDLLCQEIAEIRLRDSHGGDWSEWPLHLRVREFPEYFHRDRADERNPVPFLRPA